MNRRSKRILDLARDKSLADMTPSSSDNSQIISDSEYKLPEESEAESSWECGYRESDFFLDSPIELRQELPDSTYTTMQTIQPGLPPEENNSVDHNYCVSLRQNDNLDSEVKTPGKTRRVRRKHQCLYCNQDVGNFLRHMERNHWDEFQVQEILSLEKKSKKRIKLIDKLRREDDVYQTAKVSKLLLLSQNSALFEKNKGKPLSEIELSDEIIDESDDNYLEDFYENVLENQNPNQLKNQDQVPAFGVADIPREKKTETWVHVNCKAPSRF
ncbi:uncharacterized protein LOC132706941 [Cylas formicarius]|uniref:uncharacterized protein LOC132706941 n=1 Tax=Cylas formicarius TaxID=197179 RepID=UPI0029585668|nr:uncharacterized protein LOC132706941 [Cylas formicarius]